MSDIVERLEERIASYEQSGPSHIAPETVAVMRDAKAEIESLRRDLDDRTKIATELATELVSRINESTEHLKLYAARVDADLARQLDKHSPT